MRPDGPTTIETLTLEEFQRLPTTIPTVSNWSGAGWCANPRRERGMGTWLIRSIVPWGTSSPGKVSGASRTTRGSCSSRTLRPSGSPTSPSSPGTRFRPKAPPVGYWRVAPAVAIEVVSPSNTISGMWEKVDDYLDAGSPEVWVVDPSGETVTVHRSRRDVRKGLRTAARA